MRVGRFAALALSAAAVIGLIGCGGPGSEPPRQAPPRTVVRRAARIPDLKGRTLTQARDSLSTLSLAVLVRFPAEEATQLVPTQRVAGALHLAHVLTLALPTEVMPLSAARVGGFPGPSYIVTGQSARPGVSASSVQTLTLDVGAHPFSSRSPWLIDHNRRVRKNGTTECFSCHRETDCSYCHIALGSSARSNTRIKLTRRHLPDSR